jgi:hypothetical protein
MENCEKGKPYYNMAHTNNRASRSTTRHFPPLLIGIKVDNGGATKENSPKSQRHRGMLLQFLSYIFPRDDRWSCHGNGYVHGAIIRQFVGRVFESQVLNTLPFLRNISEWCHSIL